MAMTNKTTLNIKMTDTNLKSKTFNVGYVNPESSDGILKEFGQKISALTDMTFNEVYRTNVENITDASTDTSTSGFAFASSSGFLSEDSDTYAAAVAGLPDATSGQVVIKVNAVSSTSSIGSYITIPMREVTEAGSLTKLINLINYKAFNSYSFNTLLVASKITSSGILFDKINIDSDILRIENIMIMEDENNRSENVAAWIKNIGDNLIAIPGYNATYTELFGAGTMKGILMNKA